MLSRDELKIRAEKLVEEKPSYRDTYGNLNIDNVVDLTYTGYKFLFNDEESSLWEIKNLNFELLQDFSIHALKLKSPGIIVFKKDNEIIGIVAGGFEASSVKTKLKQEVRHKTSTGTTLKRKIAKKEGEEYAEDLIQSCQYIILSPTNSSSRSDIELTKHLLDILAESKYLLGTSNPEIVAQNRK